MNHNDPSGLLLAKTDGEILTFAPGGVYDLPGDLLMKIYQKGPRQAGLPKTRADVLEELFEMARDQLESAADLASAFLGTTPPSVPT